MNKKNKYIKRLFKASIFFISIIFLVTLAKVSDALTNTQVQQIATKVTVQIYSPDPLNPSKLIAVGSGVIIPSVRPNTYYVVTNKHVAYSGGDYTIKTFDGTKHTIEDVTDLSNFDLSWLKFTSRKNYNGVDLGDYQNLKRGDIIYIAGWPFNNNNRLKFVSGKIGRTNWSNDNDGYTILYRIPVNNGMSGGPILDTNGHLVGIHGRATTLYQLGIPINTFIENAGMNWVRICNERKPPLELSLALAKYVGNGWQTKGWYKIKPQSCRPLLAMGDDYTGKVYYYARNSEKEVWGKGPEKFCVNMQSNFTVINQENDDCGNNNLRQVQMNTVEVYPTMKSRRLVN